MSDFLNAGVFYLLAAVTIAGALGVVLAKKLVHAALLLTVTFIGVACLYFQLGADFLGAAQLMIYAGGVARRRARTTRAGSPRLSRRRSFLPSFLPRSM